MLAASLGEAGEASVSQVNFFACTSFVTAKHYFLVDLFLLVQL